MQDGFLNLGECRRQKWFDSVIHARYLHVIANYLLTFYPHMLTG